MLRVYISIFFAFSLLISHSRAFLEPLSLQSLYLSYSLLRVTLYLRARALRFHNVRLISQPCLSASLMPSCNSFPHCSARFHALVNLAIASLFSFVGVAILSPFFRYHSATIPRVIGVCCLFLKSSGQPCRWDCLMRDYLLTYCALF